MRPRSLSLSPSPNEQLDRPASLRSDQSFQMQSCSKSASKPCVPHPLESEYQLTGYFDCAPLGENVIYPAQPDTRSE